MRKRKAKVKVLSFLLVLGVISGNPSANAATDSGSIVFNGTQYLSSTNMSAPGTGAFTYEFWFYNTVETGSNQTLMNSRGSVSTFQQRDGFDVAINGTRGLFASYRSLAFFNLADGSIAINRWYHFALVRQSNTVYAYLDGNLIGSQALAGDGLNLYNQSLQIGSTVDGANKFNGYISNFRYTKSDLYSANFAKPTDDYESVTSTSILLRTKNDATFATNLISGTTFTNNGGATASARNPFEILETQAEKDAAAARKAEEERQARVREARAVILKKVSAKESLSVTELQAAEEPALSAGLLAELNRNLLALERTLEIKYSLIAFQIAKYKAYDQIAGNLAGKTYPRNLMTYGIIDTSYPMKSLAISRLMNLPVADRDSITEIDAFLSKEAARNATLKAKVQARATAKR
jgi:Concanavalin A-like lectin/glucanases superfamily